jgi:hypothetical protein
MINCPSAVCAMHKFCHYSNSLKTIISGLYYFFEFSDNVQNINVEDCFQILPSKMGSSDLTYSLREAVEKDFKNIIGKIQNYFA